MGIQVGVFETFDLLPHTHMSVAEGGKLSKYSDVFNSLDLIANILSNHSKAVHDALALDHGELSNVTPNQHHVPSGLTVHTHISDPQGGKLDKYSSVFNNLDTIVNILSNHTKAVHDALAINADKVDGEEASAIVTNARVKAHFPDLIANILSDHTKAVHDALTLDHGELSNVTPNQHHVPGGTDFKVLGFTRDLSAASGNVDYNGFGFQPRAVIAIGAMAGSVHSILGVGFSEGVTDKTICNQGFELLVGQCLSYLLYITTVAGQAQHAVVNSFIADGVTLTWTKTANPIGTFTFALIGIK